MHLKGYVQKQLNLGQTLECLRVSEARSFLAMATAGEFIPDAAEGSVPNLDIRTRPMRSSPSEGGESSHSLALSNLSKRGLEKEGIPIAQKVAGEWKYFDEDGNIISKEEAMKKAGGVVWYQDASAKSKGRLRHSGRFVSADEARSIASGSRASRCSDVANLRDLDGLEYLPAVAEDADVKEDVVETVQAKAAAWPGLGHLTWLILLAPLIFGALHASTSTQLVLGETELLHSIEPSLVWLLEKHESTQCTEDDIGCKTAPKSGYFLDAPLQEEVFHDTSPETRKMSAAAEVERILTSQNVSDILGCCIRSEQRQAFRRIAQLLHPDKGLVAPDDARAALALRLAFAARGIARD
eukprot:TRINITY_DN5696_c0_g1_i1.p1 TRINITY_DN5696_c0_g1~~TRINITY_DN5696_c0_g1_i1.p1  ORF type:complete len:354 (-),score=55.51 TRINITY_DN5696_c0_g1_i1:448-1509(-)